MYKDAKIGELVVFKDRASHLDCPRWFPPVGTIGIVKRIHDGGELLEIQWPKGKTYDNGIWLATYMQVSKYKGPILARICDFLFHRGKKNERNKGK